MEPTQKQIDFATAIAEMLGIDLPEENTGESYHEFISENVNDFYEMKREVERENDPDYWKDAYDFHRIFTER